MSTKSNQPSNQQYPPQQPVNPQNTEFKEDPFSLDEFEPNAQQPIFVPLPLPTNHSFFPLPPPNPIFQQPHVNHPSLDEAWEDLPQLPIREFIHPSSVIQPNTLEKIDQNVEVNLDPFHESAELFEWDSEQKQQSIMEFNQLDVKGNYRYAQQPHKQIKVVFAGGKGGVGRSLISANLSLYLSRLGRRDVLLADLDSAGGNLHTYLGIEPRLPLAGAILRSEVTPYLIPISGYQMSLCKVQAPLTHALTEEIRSKTLAFSLAQKSDILVMDMGALSDPLTISEFLDADYGIVMVHPDPCSIERAYQFIQTALYRKLLHGEDDAAVVSRALLSADQMGQLQSPMDLVSALKGVNHVASSTIEYRIKTFSPKILVNRCRTRADKDLGIEMCAALKRKLSINPVAIGSIENDEMAWKALMQRKALMTEYPGATISSDIERIARRLILDEKEVRV